MRSRRLKRHRHPRAKRGRRQELPATDADSLVAPRRRSLTSDRPRLATTSILLIKGRGSTTGNLVAGPRRKTLTRAEFRALLRLVRAGKIAPRKPKAPGAIQLIFDFMLH
jgi:hypothetical protein